MDISSPRLHAWESMRGTDAPAVAYTDVLTHLRLLAESKRVVGRTWTCRKYWRLHLTQDPKLLRILSEGYRLPFTTRPPRQQYRSNGSALKHTRSGLRQ